MAIKYGKGSTRIKQSDILATYTNNMDNVTQGDVAGGYEFYGTNVWGGCGNANGDAGILIVLKDDISWNRISCQFEFNKNASCWTFLGGGSGTNSPQDQNSGYGRSGPNVPSEMQGSHPYNSSSPGNIYPYNESLGDRYFFEENAFSSNANYVRKAHACDNDSTNFLHGSFNDSGYKTFWTTRRRNENGNNAGIFFGRSCSNTGAYYIVKNIYVWYEG